MSPSASYITTVKLNIRSANLLSLICFVVFVFCCYTFNFVSCAGKEANQAIIDDLISGDRCILGLGQTMKRMVVVIGRKYEEDNADNVSFWRC